MTMEDYEVLDLKNRAYLHIDDAINDIQILFEDYPALFNPSDLNRTRNYSMQLSHLMLKITDELQARDAS